MSTTHTDRAAKRGRLDAGALTDEALDSSRTVLRSTWGRGDSVVGLQQFFSPPELGRLIAEVNGRRLSTLDPTAGDGSLLAGVEREARFGIEIDADHAGGGRYEAIQGDLQAAYPLLRVLGARFPRVACNPPFGLEWQIGGTRQDSTLATWRMATALLDDRGAGAFVAGRDRFLREVLPREDAAGIYALVECPDLFEAGERYPLQTSSEIAHSTAERPHHKRNGDVEIRRYEHEAKVLRVRVGGETFDESAADVDYLLEHFELPDPGDLGTRYPEAVEDARGTLRALAVDNGFEFKTSETEDWQLEDLARLVVKGSGLLCWEQGGGKSLGGATLIHAAWERGAARKGLIVCPQDLIPQWMAEVKRFYGEEPVHITTPAQARSIARELRAGGTGLYITHYEVLSLIGRVDEPLPVVPIKVAREGEDGPVRTVVDSEEFCPNCLAAYDAGWQRESPHVCDRCRYVHKRLRVKTAGHHLAQAFADGVIVVDEGTLAKGDGSLTSKAIRGLKARHRYLLTGTPISNYVNDAFWLLWWALGNATLRFPFDYEGGRAKFEADFCVIEHFRDDKDGGRRKNRKVLPQVTNVSRLWRLLSGAMVRRRKQHMGKLPPRTTRTIAAPMGVSQQELYRFWLSTDNFRRYFEWKFPGHPLLEANLVELFAAGLGQLTKLEYATTLPEADPDLGAWPALADYEHSNWTPKNLKVLQVAMEHVEAGEKVLIGSDLIETGRWLCERLKEKGVRAAHIVEERGGRAATMNPRKRAAAIERFKSGTTQVLCCDIPSIRLGHSLEAASCVIANGLVFSYEMFDQFTARAWRLTSPGPVSVYVALTLGSLDPRKWELLCQKAKAADLALDGQLVDEPEQPISREEFLRELRRQGVRPTGEEIAEADIEAAWEAAPMLATAAGPRRPASVDREGMTTVDWHKAPVETEQLDLFAAA